MHRERSGTGLPVLVLTISTAFVAKQATTRRIAQPVAMRRRYPGVSETAYTERKSGPTLTPRHRGPVLLLGDPPPLCHATVASAPHAVAGGACSAALSWAAGKKPHDLISNIRK